jgi:MFS family permease
VRRRPAVAFVLVTVLIDVMGIGLLLPVLPALVGEFTSGRDAQTYWYGALMVTFGLAQFVCSPLLGALSDRYGRRPVLLSSIAGLGTMFFLSAIVTSLPALLATRVLGGALAANFSVANAYVADITPRRSAPAASAGSARRSASASSSAPRSAARSAPSTCACLSTPPRRCRSSTRCTDCWCCRSRCRQTAAGGSTGGGRTRWRRSQASPG